MTPLESAIREIVEAEGPIRLDRYMALCLGHPEHGYYMGHDPLGETGDFITAPEVSQAFGELIGVWCIAAWRGMGSPAPFNLVELGPGRGTLMKDLIRATGKAAADFASAAAIHLVETSPHLRKVQKNVLGAAAAWHTSLEEVPDGSSIILANEFFDTLPVRQFERRDDVWRERAVGIVEGGLALCLLASDFQSPGRDGDVIEISPARSGVARQIGGRFCRDPGACLVIDYGHTASACGDTLQAMRAHRFAAITEAPGECDLTSHVDFEALARAFKVGGATVHPPITQREFLIAMGLEARMASLAAHADSATQAVLKRQAARLAEPDQMGNLFKVLSATSPGQSTPYPFACR